MQNWPRLQKMEWLLLILALLGIGFVYGACIDTRAVGFIQDDGAYIATAKALAEGHGYRQIQVLDSPWQTRYPIGYPLFLAIGWLVNPHFPENLPFLSKLTETCALLALGIFYLIFRMKRYPVWLSAILIFLIAASPRMLFYTTAIMSEAPYMLIAALVLGLAEMPGDAQSRTRFVWVLILSVLSFHTRSIGLTLIAAITLWLFLQQRYKQATIYGTLSLLLTVGVYGGWQFFAGRFPVNIWVFQAYAPYLENFSDASSHGHYLHGLWMTGITLIQKIASGYIPIAFNLPTLQPSWHLENQVWFKIYTGLVLGILSGLLTLLLSVRAWQMLPSSENIASRLKSIPPSAWYVTFYLLASWLWGESDQISRFLVVIQPWLWMLLIFCIFNFDREPLFRSNRMGASILTLITLAYIAIIPAGYRQIYQPRKHHWVDLGIYRNLWQDYEESFRWMHLHLPGAGPIGCDRTTALYLYTGHPIFPISPVSASLFKAFPNKFTPAALKRTLGDNQVNYLLVEPIPVRLKNGGIQRQPNPEIIALLQTYPKNFTPIFQSRHHLLTLYQMK